MDGDDDGNASPAPPAFTLPMRAPTSLSSLLSSSDHDDVPAPQRDVVPITVPPPNPNPPSRLHRAGLSNLMNSPMDDDMSPAVRRHGDAVNSQPHVQVVNAVPQVVVVVEPQAAEEPPSMDVDEVGRDAVVADPISPQSTSDSPILTRQHKQSMVEINTQSVVLSDDDLERVKVEFQSAVQKYLVAEAKGDAPAAKRHKKSKQQRKSKALSHTMEESIAEIQKCIHLLQEKIDAQFTSLRVLTEVVQFCLGFCGILNEKDPIEKLLIMKPAPTLDFEATLAALAQKPLYSQLLSVIRRALMSCHDEQDASKLMTQVLEWCQAAAVPSHWMWTLVCVGQLNSYAMAEFLVHEMVFTQFDNDAARAATIPVVEYLVSKNPAQLVDIVRHLLEEAANDDVLEIRGRPVAWVVHQLVTVATEYPVFLRACDDSLQFVITRDLVCALWANISSYPLEMATQAQNEGSTWSAKFLRLLEKRSNELPYSGFQLIVLLQELAATTTVAPQLADAASAFHAQVVKWASDEESHVFVKGIYRFLPFICQSALRGLRASNGGANDPSQQRFDQWRHWLELLAKFVSAKDVTKHLIDADLMLCENADDSSSSAVAISELRGRALCGLLSSILTPLSVDYAAFVKEMMASCNHSLVPDARQTRRVLEILHTLLHGNERGVHESQGLPIQLLVTASDLSLSAAIDPLVQAESWTHSWQQFMLWKDAQGADFWEGFLDLSCSRDNRVASRALALLSQTPFRSLEDPIWQYRCLRKLTTVFFHLLRQYRAEIVSSKNSPSQVVHFEMQSRLETLKVTMFRLLALDGGVAHYPSSVYSTFASLWIDALFSTTSATSIPTHFPNRVNFSHNDEELPIDADGGRVVIRSERTISSKCTNLQSSKVIVTQFPETLVYRKTLDASWEREMDAAHTCSMYATDLLFQLLSTTVPTMAGRSASGVGRRTLPSGDPDSDQCERKLKAVVDLLLERAIPCCGIPSDDIYKETLPNRSSFDMDLRIEQWLNHFPAFLPLLRAAITTSATIHSTQSLRLVPLIKSALIVLLGHWNSVKGGDLGVENMDVPPYMRNRNQLALTCALVEILRLTGWIPPQLGKAAELLPLTSPADIRGILFSCWFYLSDHPPSAESTTVGPTPASSTTASPISATPSPAVSSGGSGANPHANVPLEFYLIPLRKALRNNIRKIGSKYPLYMC
ncbi:Membrane protein, partial [Globisporangium splendens]